MTRPTRPVWPCPACETNNDLRDDAQCIVCGHDRPVSRVRSTFPAADNSVREDALSRVPDPLTMATTLWRRLAEHQPAVAAALAMHLRALPETWAQRELGVARPHAALELPATTDMAMEIVPYHPDWEDCPACIECEELCRYHAGRTDGYQALHRPLLEAVRLDRTVTVVDVLARLSEAEEAAETGALAAAVAPLIGGR